MIGSKRSELVSEWGGETWFIVEHDCPRSFFLTEGLFNKHWRARSKSNGSDGMPSDDIMRDAAGAEYKLDFSSPRI